MSLINKVITIINNDPEKLKNISISKSTVNKINKLSLDNQINIIDKILRKKYEKHSGLNELKQLKQNAKLDDLPLIYKSDKIVISFPKSINGSYYDYLRGKKGRDYEFNTGTKYGNRLMKIVAMTQCAVKSGKNILIDFRDCHGGDINVFLASFSPIIGRGFLLGNRQANMFWNGKNMKWLDRKNDKILASKEAKIQKNIEILVNKHTSSSAEYLTMLIKSFQKKCKIRGQPTAGFLTTNKWEKFKFKNRTFSLGFTTSTYVYDRFGKKYNGRIE